MHIFTEGGLTDDEITGVVIGIAVVSVVLVGVIVILVIRSKVITKRRIDTILPIFLIFWESRQKLKEIP